MTEGEWVGCTDPTPMLDSLHGRVSERKMRLFAVACCRRIWDKIDWEGSRELLLVAERFADELASKRELQKAYDRSSRADENLWLDMDPNNVVLHVGPKLNVKSMVRSVEGILTYSGDELHLVCRDEVKFNAVVARRGADERRSQAALLHDVIGNPFRPVRIKRKWLTPTVVALATGIYAERAFDRMPILADALEEAGCDHADILSHCRGDGPHVRGCWVVDLVLGKE